MDRLLVVALVWVIQLLELAIFVRVIVSWLPIQKDGQFMRILYQITEPILGPIRNLIEKSSLGKGMMMIDFSPIIAFLLIDFVKNLLARIFHVSTILF
ncbi:MAG: YggT family protein [Clostridia bacterium]|nr:YggT family protein [Clostridia bacterium]